jgi:hypothetical protein
MTTLPSKQQALLDRCRKDGQLTTKIANEMLEHFYYHNHEKYVSEILGRMVKNGSLVRVKPGLFELGTRKHSEPIIVNQSKLF